MTAIDTQRATLRGQDNPFPQDPITDSVSGGFVRITARTARESSIGAQLQELWRYRHIVWLIAARNLRLRYKGSVLGIFWSMIMPVVQVAVLTIVIGRILAAGPKDMSAYMLCAFLPWIFFSTALLDSASSVLAQVDLLKKVYLPREVLPIAGVVANLVHFFAALIIFIIYRYGVTTVLFGWPGWPAPSIVWFPVVVFDMIAFTTGLAFFFSAWTTFHEDVKYIVQAGLQIFFYAVPIIYFAENIFFSRSGSLRNRSLIYHVYLLDPIAWFVTAFKQMFFNVANIASRGARPIMSAPFDWRYCAITTATSLTTLVIGYLFFNRLKWRFTERP